jgi:hypothetical protein
MNVLCISLCNPQQITDPQELREALERANQQIIQLGNQLDCLTRGTHGLTTELAVMCEAHLAGDAGLVAQKVSEFANHSRQHCQPGVKH